MDKIKFMINNLYYWNGMVLGSLHEVSRGGEHHKFAAASDRA